MLKTAPLLTLGLLLTAWHDDPRQADTGQPVSLVQESPVGAVDAHSARISARGSHVVFVSYAALSPRDTNRTRDVFVFDLATGRLTLESRGVGETVANGESISPGISGDGRYVVFVSVAGNLTDPQILPGMPRIYLRDRETGTTQLITTSRTGAPANGYSSNPAISADGTTIVFESAASDLVDGTDAPPHTVGVYLIRPSSGERARLDVSSTGEAPGEQAMSPAVSAEGRYVAYTSRANLTCASPMCPPEAPDRNGVADVYLRDTATHTTKRVSISRAGLDPNGASYAPAISGNGRFVAFVSEASTLTRDARTHVASVYVRDVVTGITELVSRTLSGRQANGRSLHPAVSSDGGTVAFQSLASDLLCSGRCQSGQRDTNLVWDVFVHDRRTRRTIRASADGAEEWMEESRAPSMDDIGRVIVFASRHPRNDRDEGHDEDLYVRLAKP